MKYSNKILDLFRALCAIAFVLVSANACTEVDYRLGESLLPKNQRMKVKVETLEEGIDTYLYKEDSIASSRLGYVWFGREEDPNGIFGRRKNSFIVQFLPAAYPASYRSGEAYKNFGLDPIIDSMCIVLPLYDVHGDTTRVQKFNVYEISEGPAGTGNLHRDSIYYINFPIDDYKGDLLFSFEHTGRRGVSVKLDPTTEGKNFLKRIVAVDMEDVYTVDSVFLETFRGLYVTPADESSIDAAVYASDLADAGMIMYSRCHDTLDVSAIYDTMYTSFSFRDTDDSSYNIKWDNVSVNMVEFEYPAGTTLGNLETSTDGFTDTLETSATRPLMYVQSMGGVAGYLRFTEDVISTLRNLKYEIDEKSGETVENDILIDQAMMYIWLDDTGDIITMLDNSIKRLGSYSDLKTLTPIPDYMYYYELQYQSSNADYTLPYNGYLNRSNAYYEFDITSFVQQLAKGEPGEPNAIDPVIELAPEAYGMFRFGQSVLQGTPEPGDTNAKPIKIRLTYTLIEK